MGYHIVFAKKRGKKIYHAEFSTRTPEQALRQFHAGEPEGTQILEFKSAKLRRCRWCGKKG